VEPRHVGEGPGDAQQVVHPLEEPGLQLGVVEVLGERPAQPGLGRPAAVLEDGPQADPAGAGHRPLGQPPPHRSRRISRICCISSLAVAIPAPPCAGRHLTGAAALPMRVQDGRNRRSGIPRERGDHLAPQSVFRILRNRCSRSIGIGVQDAPEYASDVRATKTNGAWRSPRARRPARVCAMPCFRCGRWRHLP
jgi:hypothetical protein